MTGIAARTIRRISLLAAAVTTGLGLAVGAVVVVLPSRVRCELPPLEPGVGSVGGPQNCSYVNLLASGEPVWPLPMAAIAVWSLAPALGLLGVIRMLQSRSGMPLLGLALAIEATAVISFVVGPMFVLYVFLPLLLTTVMAWISAIAGRIERVVRRPAGG